MAFPISVSDTTDQDRPGLPGQPARPLAVAPHV